MIGSNQSMKGNKTVYLGVCTKLHLDMVTMSWDKGTYSIMLIGMRGWVVAASIFR